MRRVVYQLLTRLLWLVMLCDPCWAGWPTGVAEKIHDTSISSALKSVMPAIVNVSAQGELPLNPLPGSVTGPAYPHHFQSTGSGVIIDDKKGYILTNAHVIREAKSITVTLKDGRVFKAALKGADIGSDIALLIINPDHLTQIQLGNSDNLQVGDFVAAIGNPFGLNQTVTSGIVSGLQRTGLGIEDLENFIQTDAAINPGNSGGALINLKGQLIGINTAILSSANAGNIGIGFAIPINMAYAIMQQLAEYGSVKRGLMGVFVQDLTPALANAFHLASNTDGALVTQVPAYSSATAAGIQIGDIITSMNGVAIHNAGQVKNIVSMLRVDNKVSIEWLRKGRLMHAAFKLKDVKQHKQTFESKNPFLYGMILRDFDQTVIAEQGGRQVGVEVMNIDENSMAWHAGIQPGDVITSANQITVTHVAQLEQIAKNSKDQLLVNVLSRNGIRFVVIK